MSALQKGQAKTSTPVSERRRSHHVVGRLHRTRWICLDNGRRNECPGESELGEDIATGKQAVVPNAMKALGQHMDQEATDELVGRQRHRLVAAWPIDPIVLVPEGDAVLVGGYEAAIGDGHAVGVAG